MEELFTQMLQIDKKIRERVAEVPSHLLLWKPAPDSWSILEVAGHLVDVDLDYWLVKARLIAATDGVALERNFDQAELVRQREYNNLTLDQIIERLVQSRQQLVDYYRSLPVDVLAHRGIFPSGPRSLSDFIPSAVRHDDSHLRQIDRVKEQLRAAGLL